MPNKLPALPEKPGGEVALLKAGPSSEDAILGLQLAPGCGAGEESGKRGVILVPSTPEPLLKII